jgi:predicted nuclease with TOPRIM domain
MGNIIKAFRGQAQALVARYRQRGVILSELEARELEREIQNALVRAWAGQRVSQMAASQIREPLKSIRKKLDQLVPEIERVVRS